MKGIKLANGQQDAWSGSISGTWWDIVRHGNIVTPGEPEELDEFLRYESLRSRLTLLQMSSRLEGLLHGRSRVME